MNKHIAKPIFGTPSCETVTFLADLAALREGDAA